MEKFYRELPQQIVDILAISDGWLVGGAIKDIKEKKVPKDYDIIVPKKNYRKVFRFVNQYSPKLNSHGGIKVQIGETSVDIWIDSLDSFLRKTVSQSYLYHFNKNIMLHTI